MKTIKKISLLLVGIVVLAGCQDYNTLVKNPNLPTTVPPSLIFTGILNTMNDDNAWNNGSTTGAQTFNQFWLSTYTYYGTNNYDQSPYIGSSFYYITLQNVVQMELEAKNSGATEPNPYSALGKFFRAYYYNLMSQKMGDIPLSAALQASADKDPVYDAQKDIYIQILKWLDESNTELAAMVASPGSISLPLTGDIYLANDLSKWQKVVNAFTLRVLISLSKKDTDTDLQIKQKFATILGNPSKYPLMAGLSDNVDYHFNAQFNIYPKNPGNIGFTISRENVASTFLDLTTSLNDPRTFIAATPAPTQLAAGKLFSDQAAYVGANPGDDMSTLGTRAQNGDYSYVNGLRYYATYDGSSAEPGTIIGYPEMCFNIAEGINRGWTTGNAGTWYTNGIQASFSRLGITEGSKITVADFHLVPYGTVTVSISAYLAQAAVAYKGDDANGLNQILTQKYLGFWQNSNWEAFFNQRRTGVPVFRTGAGTGNGGVIPQRWQYPYAESTANAANYTSAVGRQFAGADNLNGKLWIVQ